MTVFALGVGALAAPPGWFPALLIMAGVVLGACAIAAHVRGDKKRDTARRNSLRSIAALLREAPEKHTAPINCATLCGSYLVDALDLGFLSGDSWRSVRHIMRLAQEGRLEHMLSQPTGSVRPAPEWHVFVNGYTQVRGDGYVGTFSEKLVRAACERWAELIEQEATGE